MQMQVLLKTNSDPVDSIPAMAGRELTSEAGKLIDEIRRALFSDLTLATKKAATLSDLLSTKSRHCQPIAPLRGGLAGWRKAKVENHIRAKLDESLLIEDLANNVGLSASHFCRAFKESFGETPHAYIMRLRVKHAQTLMLNTSENLSQIALACGLVDQSHLCRCFRQITGATPGAWRRDNASGPASGATRWATTAGSHGAPATVAP